MAGFSASYNSGGGGGGDFGGGFGDGDAGRIFDGDDDAGNSFVCDCSDGNSGNALSQKSHATQEQNAQCRDLNCILQKGMQACVAEPATSSGLHAASSCRFAFVKPADETKCTGNI